MHFNQLHGCLSTHCDIWSILQADPLALASDSIQTSIGEVVSLLKILSQEDVEREYATAGVAEMQANLAVLPPSTIDEVVLKFPAQV